MTIGQTVYELAGIVGIDPGPLTLRELAWMAGARQRAEWDRTANVLALLANVHRDPKRTRAYRPSDFHPFAPARSALRKVRGAELRDALKEAFLPIGERQVTLRSKP